MKKHFETKTLLLVTLIVVGVCVRKATVATMPQKMTVEERLVNFKARSGFEGIVSPSGKDVHRRCACGKATASLDNPVCVHCEKASGLWRRGKRTREYERRGDEAREESRAPKASYQAPPAEPVRYLQCRTKNCGHQAKRRGTLCQSCYIAADPETRACPVCKKAPRCTTQACGICHTCMVKIDRAAGRLWEVSGGHMALACSALAQRGMEADSERDANQLLEALEAGALVSEAVNHSVFNS